LLNTVPLFKLFFVFYLPKLCFLGFRINMQYRSNLHEQAQSPKSFKRRFLWLCICLSNLSHLPEVDMRQISLQLAHDVRMLLP
jgi:hypothetical protein